MKVRKPVAIVFAIFLLIIVAFAVFNPQKAYASRPDVIPKAFGELKGTMGSNLIFEAKDGTIRLVSLDENRLITIARQ